MKELNKVKNIILFGLFALALFFCFYKITESPPVWYDEGWYIQTSANWLEYGIDGLQLSPGYIEHVSVLTVCYPLLYPLMLWFKVFGISIISARSLMVIFILAFIIGAYLFSKRLFGKDVAIWSPALLVTFPPLYANGKSVLGEVPGLFYIVLFFLLYNIAQTKDKNKNFWMFVAGIASGLAITTKPVYLLLLPSILIGVWYGYRRKNLSLKDIGLGTLGIIIPIVVWFIVQFPSGTTYTEVLSFYANPYNIDILDTIFENLKRIISDVGPLFTLGIMVIWIFSLYVRRRIQEKIKVEEIIAFSFSVLVSVAFLRTGGAYRYLFYTQGLSLIFLPYTLLIICRFVLIRYDQKVINNIKNILLFLVCILGLYQVVFDSWVAESYGSHKTQFWQEYFTQVSSSTSIFFYDVPEVVPFIESRNYYQALRTPAGHPLGIDRLDFLKNGNTDMVITTTAIYKENEAGLFHKYKQTESPYKYSILIRKK